MKRGTKGIIASVALGAILAVGGFGTYKYYSVRNTQDAKRTAAAVAMFNKGANQFNSGHHVKAIAMFEQAKETLDCESHLHPNDCYKLDKSLASAIKTGNICEEKSLDCKIKSMEYEAKIPDEKSETDSVVLKIQEAQKREYNESDITELENLCIKKCNVEDKSYKGAWIGISNMWMNEITEREKENRETNWAKNSRIKALKHALEAKNLAAEEQGLLHYNLALLYETTWVDSADGRRYLTDESKENYRIAKDIFSRLSEEDPKNINARFFQLETKYREIDEYCYDSKVKDNIASGEMNDKDHKCYPYVAGLDAKNLIHDYNTFLKEFAGKDANLKEVVGDRISSLETLIDQRYEHGGAPLVDAQIGIEDAATGTLRADVKTDDNLGPVTGN